MLSSTLFLNIHHNGVGLCEVLVLAEDLHTPLVKSLAKSFGIPDDLVRVLLAKFLVLGNCHTQCGSCEEMMIAHDSREDPRVQPPGHLVVLGIRDKYPMLWAGECLVGTAGYDIRAFSQRILESASSYEAENMCSIVPDITSDLIESVLKFLQGSGEKKYRSAEQS